MVSGFRAFIDESRSSDEFVMAGHIAAVDQWAAFAREWEAILPIYGTRAKNGDYHFHMVEMAQSPERMARVPIFYKLIEDHVITSISCRINLQEFERAKARVISMAERMNWHINLHKWANPYFFSYRALLDKFHEERIKEPMKTRFPLGQKVDLYFDERSEKAFIIEAWEQYLNNQNEEIREHYGAAPRFEKDHDFIALQGADLWAWWVREWYEEDAVDVPVKLSNFDFGTWRGKPRPNIIMSANEDQIVEVLQGVVASGYADGLYFTIPPFVP
ncbi:MAG: DUF3800 domain-containing protein [Hyphomicrobiales bacterium]|nr:DUF3800 domain-containing protein [Hyphomicrobiales bacterium]MBV8827156.1 DUF3800 domain-containing protein [Hyphomicrobiales bacterium]MBV9427946.1 DUF3800 domain-containing protein [Bradyrhizobiaceae bacterium]